MNTRLYYRIENYEFLTDVDSLEDRLSKFIFVWNGIMINDFKTSVNNFRGKNDFKQNCLFGTKILEQTI